MLYTTVNMLFFSMLAPLQLPDKYLTEQLEGADKIFVSEYRGTSTEISKEKIDQYITLAYVFNCKNRCHNFMTSEYYNWIKNLRIVKKQKNVDMCLSGYSGKIVIRSDSGKESSAYVSFNGRCLSYNDNYYIGNENFPIRNIIR